MLDWLQLLTAILIPLVPLYFFSGCVCCGPDCTVFEDDFSVDNLSTDYDTRSGTWNVTGGEVQTASGSALLIANDGYGSETACHAEAVVQCSSTGDAARVVILYGDDSNYWFAEVQPGATNGSLKLYERAGGANTQRGSTITLTGFTAGTTVAVRICYASGTVTANASVGGGYKAVHFNSTETVAGTKAGIGTGSVTSRVDFTSLSITRHGIETVGCPACGKDCDYCDEGSFPDVEAAITFTGLVTNSNWLFCDRGCDTLNGITFILPVSGGNCLQNGTFNVDCTSTTQRSVDIGYQTLFFGSGSGTPGNYRNVSYQMDEVMYFEEDHAPAKPPCYSVDANIPFTIQDPISTNCNGTGASVHVVV